MGRSSERKPRLKERLLLKKKFMFKGKEYSSYYQLEKVMGIPRKTIQNRHEVIGIPIDEIPNFRPKPPLERFGDKRIVFASSSSKKKKFNNEELKKIIEYPRVPDFRIDGNDEDRTEEEKRKYEKWIQDAPETLLKRELHLNKKDLARLLAGEKEIYFFPSPFHEEEKQTAEAAIKIIQGIAAERNIDLE